MALYQCVGRHFAAGGQLVKVGDTANFDKCPGSLWQKLDEPEAVSESVKAEESGADLVDEQPEPEAELEPEEVSEKKLEVATPKKPAAKK